MKSVFIIIVIFAGIYQSAVAQGTTTAVSAVSAVSADSVQMVPDMSKADELFLFKNNDGISAESNLVICKIAVKNCNTYFPFSSMPDCCPMSVVCQKLKKSVMLAQIR
ncbi:MAG: hypothetical protein A2W93_06960 [Bacteroidetes bacterium GWF2_43_63]|nr:MAG: hypothetical protein A2W94_09920 [Bacteroidetes bacterium GWE2_42_42]OFY53754.1 MAG: hypothetical protein A2W93_06960 [Bacteroidetes bacterium GWF2_43_63]HCB61035.1 hypothetical protein [Bacteroidales bacterium]HCY24157.1 hypothetical protein [Bacteroidales bacterium]